MERPTLAFVPGFMQRCDAWAAVADRLGERYPSALLERADELPQPGVVPVGYSMGGRIALHARARRAGPLAGARARGRERRASTIRRRAARPTRSSPAWIESSTIEEVVARWEAQPVFATQPPELVAAQRAGRLSHDPGELARLLRTYGQGVMPPVWDRLAELELPVLLLAGALDEKYVAAGRRMAVVTAGRRVPRRSAGAGHAPQLEDPDAVAAELRAFLDERL